MAATQIEKQVMMTTTRGLQNKFTTTESIPNIQQLQVWEHWNIKYPYPQALTIS